MRDESAERGLPVAIEAGVNAARRPILGGALVAGAGGALLASLADRGQGATGPTPALYAWPTLATAAAVAVAGVLLLARPLAPWAGPAAVGAAVGAAHLTGTGIVAFVHAEPALGMCCGNYAELTTVRLAAAGFAAGGALALLAALSAAVTVLVRGATLRIPPASHRWIGLGAGLLVAVAVPLGAEFPATPDLRTAAACALIWSLPFGAGLAVTPWLEVRGVVAACLSVTFVALLSQAEQMPSLLAATPYLAMTGTAFAACAVMISRTPQPELTPAA